MTGTLEAAEFLHYTSGMGTAGRWPYQACQGQLENRFSPRNHEDALEHSDKKE